MPRILAPIVQCIDSLPQLVEDTAFHSYVSQEWGSIDGLRLQILSDFFKHGFDGSGMVFTFFHVEWHIATEANLLGVLIGR